MKKNRFLVTLGTLLLIILNSSAQRVLHPRTTARFYKILDPCDYDLEDRPVEYICGVSQT